ncbi:MAG: NADH-quinone oxidoreductase subunit NuoE [Xanthomonadales bacterium]|nr:NADH-quinone oxidoreductase subunit NuoE [Xanthomonadales bacterium]
MNQSEGLSKKEINAIKQEISHYEDKSAASIEALKIVQKHRGWVSDESLKATAALLELSADKLDGVATFYNLIYRRPVGKKVIHYCNSVSCWMLGSDNICATISTQLGIKPGETTEDGEYTLLPIVCLGDCDHAPVMLIGDKLHRNLDEIKIAELFEN